MRSCYAKRFAVLIIAAGSIGAVVSGASGAFAAPEPGYPARSIRMIVPFAPGVSNDIMGRYLAQ